MNYIEIALIVIAIVWMMLGYFDRRIDKARREGYEDADQELQDFYDSLAENREADELLNDPERVQHIQDKFND